jgi:hypothetical protein
LKIEDVPQDDNDIFKGHGTKVMYAVGDNGKYTTVKSSGWDVEELVLLDVVNDFKEKAEEAKNRIRKGETSPIEYFMLKNFMDLPALARGMGIAQWRVRRHMRPDIFKKLDDRLLRTYADFFNIGFDTLKHFKENI